MRKIAARIHTYPVFTLRDGKLQCQTMALGGTTVTELIEPGEMHFHEPNRAVDYVVRAVWEGSTFVATRHSDAVNNGKPTVQRRWLSGADELTITQDWGGARPFTAVYTRSR